MFNSLKVLEAEAGMVLESPLLTCDETELSLNIQERLFKVVSKKLPKKQAEANRLKSKRAEYIFFSKKTRAAKMKKLINCDKFIYLKIFKIR
jgi:hypothetical protein